MRETASSPRLSTFSLVDTFNAMSSVLFQSSNEGKETRARRAERETVYNPQESQAWNESRSVRARSWRIPRSSGKSAGKRQLWLSPPDDYSLSRLLIRTWRLLVKDRNSQTWSPCSPRANEVRGARARRPMGCRGGSAPNYSAVGVQVQRGEEKEREVFTKEG